MLTSEGKNRLYLFFTGFILIQVFFLLFSESTVGYGGMENIFLYRNGRFLFHHPELLFEKHPFYILLLSPFSQFGYLPAKAFNIMLAVFSLLLSAKIINRLYPGGELFALVVIAFSPAFFQLSASCLPDILFGFLLVSSIWLFISKRFFFSALVISFIPFVLPQGFLVLLFFAVVFTLNRRYRFVPFLLSGTILYSIAGLIATGDFLWYFKHIPENFSENLSFLPFVQSIPFILGIPLIILAVAGLISRGFETLKKNSFPNENSIHHFLITGSWIAWFVSIFVFHESSKSGGFATSTGAVVPLLAITGMKIFREIPKYLKTKNLTIILFSVIGVLQVIQLFGWNNLLKKASPEEQLMEKTAAYLRFNEPDSKLIFYNPLLAHFLELDPVKEPASEKMYSGSQQPSGIMDWDDVLVWDSWNSPDEGGLQLANLEGDPYLKKIMSFKPVELESDSAKNDCSVHIFKKAEHKEDSKEISDYYRTVLSFEKYKEKRAIETDGRIVWKLDSLQDYSPSIRFAPDVVIRQKNYEITAALHFKALQFLKFGDVLFVFSAESNGVSLHYKKADLITEGDEWKSLNLQIEIPSDIPESTQFLIYIWNKERKNVLIEKIEVEVKSY